MTEHSPGDQSPESSAAASPDPAYLDGLNWVRATDDPDPDAVCIEIAEGSGDLVHLRQSNDRGTVVTTTQRKWEAFVLGVRNNEFDHFVVDAEDTGETAR